MRSCRYFEQKPVTKKNWLLRAVGKKISVRSCMSGTVSVFTFFLSDIVLDDDGCFSGGEGHGILLYVV